MCVVDHTLPYLILGLPELSKFNFTIDCSHLQIKQNGNIVNKINKYKNERKYSLHINEGTYATPLHSQISEDQNLLPQIVIEYRCELREILSHYDSIFSKDLYDVSQLRVEPQRIILKSDLPVHFRPYRTSPIQEKEIKGQVEKLLQAGLIKESYSPYSAPVTLAFKRDEGKKTILCIDFRKLNALCKADSEPLPIMDSLLDKLARAKFFSTLDLASGYWHVTIHPKDTEKLAFCTNFGLYEWCRLPFGIKDPDLTCHVFVDASQKSVGAVLKQPDASNVLHPIAYHSRTLRDYEKNYARTELECLAIIDALDKFYYSLHGQKFIIHTGHAALVWLKNVKNLRGRLFRWSLKLSMYDYEIKYLKGSTN
ncbi:retrovirus-related Pol polyprotein from transposon 412 [Trichonephila clavipes]|nr:retrovirus-related Pol polyprotein from transposon 412 [Trichonephila clavipes]